MNNVARILVTAAAAVVLTTGSISSADDIGWPKAPQTTTAPDDIGWPAPPTL